MAFKNIVFSALYCLFGNGLFDRVFWKLLNYSSAGIQSLLINLRYFQISTLSIIAKYTNEQDIIAVEKNIKMIVPFRQNKRPNVCYDKAKDNRVKNKHENHFRNNTSKSEGEKELVQPSQNYPKISIVTPNYNQGEFLERCIHSVLSQGYPSLEFIIIDGGSTDTSLEIIKKYEKHLVYWVSEKDNGQADAINKGLAKATGDIFNWINSDDYLEPGALVNCAEAYLNQPRAVGWIGGCRRITVHGDIINVIYPNGFDRENIGQNWYGTQFYQPACFLSTAIVKRAGGLDPKLYIALDLDLWLKVLKFGEFVAGKGIWSNAIIHAAAKTQDKNRVIMETSEVQERHGFSEGAAVRKAMLENGGVFQCVHPGGVKGQSRQAPSFPFRKRRHLCLIVESPGAWHDIYGFIKHVYPVIDSRFPCELHLLWDGGDELHPKIENRKVKIIATRGSLEKFLINYKACVFPSREMGVSKQVFQAILFSGIPVVATHESISKQHFRDGIEGFVAETPEEFAYKCIQVLTNQIAWHSFSRKMSSLASG